MMTQGTKDDKWGYFRPGYFPLQDDSIAPAMVCLTEAHTDDEEPNVQFILVKADCCLKVWEDALFVSETDFDHAKNKSDCLNELMTRFMEKGYLPLNKIKSEVQFMSFH
ncbi:MAG: hypothetical protein SFW07_05840 [Gammaproteobacteria bacterium]|nr:hypothetical protein [Gammaproteobacteria bacterium]